VGEEKTSRKDCGSVLKRVKSASTVYLSKLAMKQATSWSLRSKPFHNSSPYQVCKRPARYPPHHKHTFSMHTIPRSHTVSPTQSPLGLLSFKDHYLSTSHLFSCSYSSLLSSPHLISLLSLLSSGYLCSFCIRTTPTTLVKYLRVP
jgi:hypothetical protein